MNKSTPKKTAEEPGNARKTIVVNRRARHEYFIEDTWEAGLELVGTEVKSIRASKTNIQDAFCRVEDGQIWIFQMHVAPYEQGTYWNVEPRRKRRLLLHKSEIHTIRIKTEQKGLTLIPLKVFFHHGYAKVEIGLAKGKKLYDKREDIAQKDMEREQRRATFGRE